MDEESLDARVEQFRVQVTAAIRRGTDAGGVSYAHDVECARLVAAECSALFSYVLRAHAESSDRNAASLAVARRFFGRHTLMQRALLGCVRAACCVCDADNATRPCAERGAPLTWARAAAQFSAKTYATPQCWCDLKTGEAASLPYDSTMGKCEGDAARVSCQCGYERLAAYTNTANYGLQYPFAWLYAVVATLAAVCMRADGVHSWLVWCYAMHTHKRVLLAREYMRSETSEHYVSVFGRPDGAEALARQARKRTLSEASDGVYVDRTSMAANIDRWYATTMHHVAACDQLLCMRALSVGWHRLGALAPPSAYEHVRWAVSPASQPHWAHEVRQCIEQVLRDGSVLLDAYQRQWKHVSKKLDPWLSMHEPLTLLTATPALAYGYWLLYRPGMRMSLVWYTKFLAFAETYTGTLRRRYTEVVPRLSEKDGELSKEENAEFFGELSFVRSAWQFSNTPFSNRVNFKHPSYVPIAFQTAHELRVYIDRLSSVAMRRELCNDADAPPPPPFLEYHHIKSANRYHEYEID